jgi:hypothetical protein
MFGGHGLARNTCGRDDPTKYQISAVSTIGWYRSAPQQENENGAA